MNQCSELLKQLVRDAPLYMDLINPTSEETRVCVNLYDMHESATLVIAEEIKVLEGAVNPELTISMRSTVLQAIVEGEADAFALAGRGRATQRRPIEFEIHTRDRGKEVWEVGKALLTYFFTPGTIKTRNLTPERAGQAHGAHPIPLVYWNGVRCSWILIKAGETLNEAGEKDPWPQLFIILEGRGKALIGDSTIQVEPETVVYVPTHSTHQVAAEDDLKLLWLAWNAW
jgi:mannose-6-phosphate isomerase-like protein (cupin superfamily)